MPGGDLDDRSVCLSANDGTAVHANYFYGFIFVDPLHGPMEFEQLAGAVVLRLALLRLSPVQRRVLSKHLAGGDLSRTFSILADGVRHTLDLIMRCGNNED